MIYETLCPICGANLKKIDDNNFVCDFCASTYSESKLFSKCKMCGANLCKIDENQCECEMCGTIYTTKNTNYGILCTMCGGGLEKIDDTVYRCPYCSTEFSAQKVESEAEKYKELLQNAKQHLYKAATQTYISCEELLECCLMVKKYAPSDFLANFYETFITKSKGEVLKMIRKIDFDYHGEYLETVITFIIKMLDPYYVLETKALIQRAFLRQDTEKYVKYITMVENEMEKLDVSACDCRLKRDVFVAYAAKDIDKVIELVEYLEGRGLSCFVALRNLRHGEYVMENYTKALKNAIDSCKCFVFVSSTNSRNISSDAFGMEIPYVMNKDKENAPSEISCYSSIPYKYKKPRVEYRIQESAQKNFADEFIDEFFEGYERAYTLEQVAEMVEKY